MAGVRNRTCACAKILPEPEDFKIKRWPESPVAEVTGPMKLKSISRLGQSCTIAICLLTLLAGGVLGQEGRKAISQPTPIYPQLARKSGLSGTVKVQVVIAPDGTVKDVKVVGGHPLFIDATLDALKKWKYAPSSSETTTVLEFNFRP